MTRRQERYELMNSKDVISVLEIPKSYNFKNIKISDVEYFFRKVRKNFVFFCIKDFNYQENKFTGTDGRLFYREISLKRCNGICCFSIPFILADKIDLTSILS